MSDKRTTVNEGEVRCACGNLMARRTAAGLELKCRRCKRIVVLQIPPADGRWTEVTLR